MNRNVERTLSEIEQRVGRLRAGLADLSETLERASSARANDDAQRVRDLEARRAHIAALERRALANAVRPPSGKPARDIGRPRQ